MTRLLLINETYPGGVVVRCDRCADTVIDEDGEIQCFGERPAPDGCYVKPDWGCFNFKPKDLP